MIHRFRKLMCWLIGHSDTVTAVESRCVKFECVGCGRVRVEIRSWV